MDQHMQRLRAALATALTVRQTANDNVRAIRDRVEAAAGDPTTADVRELRGAVENRDEADSVVEDLRTQIVEREAEATVTERVRAEWTGSGVMSERTFSPATTSSRDIYTPEADRSGERSYFADLFRKDVLHDVGAAQRIASYEQEARAGSTGSFAGLVPPAYLTEQAALLARTGRPFIESIHKEPLPSGGASLRVPRSTTGASAAIQATENSTVSQTDEVWGDLTIPVVTIAGSAQVSRQSLERGFPGLDNLIFTDLAGAYFAAQDLQTLSGTGSAGQMLGTLNTAGITQAAAFTAAATIATFYGKVNGLISAISSTRMQPADTIAMHPRRYAWLTNQFDSQGRPLLVPGPGMNAMGSDGAGGPLYGMTGATFLGLKVVIDPNLPISVGSGPEDQVIVYRAQDPILWQEGDGMPTQLRFEQTAGTSLTVTLVAYGYSAFTAGRYPAAVGVAGGNSGAGFGLVAPTF